MWSSGRKKLKTRVEQLEARIAELERENRELRTRCGEHLGDSPSSGGPAPAATAARASRPNAHEPLGPGSAVVAWHAPTGAFYPARVVAFDREAHTFDVAW
jgi:hypothetical protein